MDKYIKRETAIAIIEEKQKELCPVGRYGRHYVYGSDREKYDAWGEIIDALENIPSADVAPIRHGHWISVKAPIAAYECSECMALVSGGDFDFCPHCGAKMDGGEGG